MPENEFMRGLVGGLFIIALMLLAVTTDFAVAFPERGPAPAERRGIFFGSIFIPDAEEILAAQSGTFRVGTEFVESSYSVALGDFGISTEKRTYAFSGGEVKNGLLFGETRLRYEIENPANMRFTIDSENGMGDLVVFVSGRELAKGRYARGVHELALEESGIVLIELVAESSSWKIWAPALYNITRVEFEATQPQAAFAFSLDADRFASGVIELSMRDFKGQFVLLLNGNVIYRGFGSSFVTVPFGTPFAYNELQLRALGDSDFDGTAYLRYTLTDKIVRKLELPFTISKEQIEKLPGRIFYDIASVHSQGGISAKIVHEGESFVMVEPVSWGTRLLVLREEHVREGENTLVIEGTDDALFTVRDVVVAA